MIKAYSYYYIICIAYCWTFEEKVFVIKNVGSSLFLKDFSLYSNAPQSDYMQSWALGRRSCTAVIIWSLLRLAAYLSTLFTLQQHYSSGRGLEVWVGREIEELGFFSTKFPSRKDLIVNFLLQTFFPQMFNIRQYK